VPEPEVPEPDVSGLDVPEPEVPEPELPDPEVTESSLPEPDPLDSEGPLLVVSGTAVVVTSSLPLPLRPEPERSPDSVRVTESSLEPLRLRVPSSLPLRDSSRVSPRDEWCSVSPEPRCSVSWPPDRPE
jgi:hypothetical protein